MSMYSSYSSSDKDWYANLQEFYPYQIIKDMENGNMYLVTERKLRSENITIEAKNMVAETVVAPFPLVAT